MNHIDKEVYFHQYCKTCKHGKKKEEEKPCRDCLEYPTNEHSHKPVYWEENK